MARKISSKQILVFIALLLATNILAIMQNDMVVEYASETTTTPTTTTTTATVTVTEPAIQAPDTKQTPSDQVENDLSTLKSQPAEPVVGDSGPVGDEKTADDAIFATITIKVPATVAEEKIEPKQAEAASSSSGNLVVNSSAGDANRTAEVESSTPTPFVVVNKADMQSFEEWKEMRLKDAAQLKDKQQQQQQQQASQSNNNNVSSQQQANAAAVGTAGTASSQPPSQNGQAGKPDKEPSAVVKKPPLNGGGELTNGADSSGLLHRRKNYASADCGAKIIASNPEANNPSHVLSESKDDYMLNSCKSNIWFVVELCEPVKISEVEIANLELFSNVPRQFNVYASERFPQTSNGKEWQNKYWLGTFEAANTRSIQHFAIHSDHNNAAHGDSNGQSQGQDKETGASSAGLPAASNSQQLPNVIMFSKYVRFEMVSHYGTEHYCPLSLVRIYGTSMADEEEVMQTNEIDEDHHHLTLNPESIKTPSAASTESTDNIKILINENDFKADPVKAPEVPPAVPVVTPAVDDKKPAPPKANKFLGSLQTSLINSIIRIFPSENFNITKLFGSLTGNRNYFGRHSDNGERPSSSLDSTTTTGGSKTANNMGKPTKSTIIMENQTNDASSRTSNRNNPPRTPITVEPSVKESVFMPVVLTNYMFKNKEERDRAVTLQIDLHKLLCSSGHFGSSAIHLDDSDVGIDCCQCWTESTNASIQRSRAGLVTKYCGYYFIMMTSAQSRSHSSLLSKYVKNTHLSLPQSEDENRDLLFTRISINNINYYILNELLDNRTEPVGGPSVLSTPLTSEPKPEDRPLKTPLEPSAAIPSSQKTADGANLSEKNESKNSEDEEKVRYTNLTTNESDLLDRDPSKGTDSSMGKFNLESERGRHQQQQTIKETPSPPPTASSNSSSQEAELLKEAEESGDKEIDAHASTDASDLESALKTATTEEVSEPSSQDGGDKGQQQQVQPPAQNGAGASQVPRPTQPIVIGNGKEALIMRLSNRIKMLELNMTLSSQYLEKLSQHYKKQMDEMQRAFNLTTSALKNATRIADERELKLQERIAAVEKRLESTQTFIDSLNLYILELKFETDLIMFVGIVFVVVVIILELIRCMRHAFVAKPSAQKTGSREVDTKIASALPPAPPPSISKSELESLISRQIELYFEKQGLAFNSNAKPPTNEAVHFQLETIRPTGDYQASDHHVSDKHNDREDKQQPPNLYDVSSDPVDKQVTTAAAVVSSTLTAVVAAVSLAAAAKASCAAKLNTASGEEIDA